MFEDVPVGYPVNTFDLGSADAWARSGTATTNAAKSLVLTPIDSGAKGAAWVTERVTQKSWEVRLWIKVEGEKEKPGKGMGFWFTKNPEKPGILYGSNEKFDGLGLLFDSFDDDNASDNPIIMTWLNNGTKLFHHDTDGLGTRFGGCRAKYRNRKKPVGVRISYVAEEETLQVKLHMGGKAGWEACVAKDGIKLPTSGHFGLSAANRKDASGDSHEILALKMWDLKKKSDMDQERESAANAEWQKDDSAPGRQTHELVDVVSKKGRNLQDELLENLSEQVRRDRTYKIKEFGDMHRNLNQALDSFDIPSDTVVALSTSIQDLQTQMNLVHEEMSLTRITMEAASKSKNAKSNMITLDTCIAQLGAIDAVLQKRAQQHDASSEQMLMYKQQVTKSIKQQEQDGSGYFWTILMVVEAIIVFALFFIKPPSSQRYQPSRGGMIV